MLHYKKSEWRITVTGRCILCAVRTAELDPGHPGIMERMPSLRREKLARLKRAEDRQRSVCAELALQAAFALWGAKPLAYACGEKGRPVLPEPWDLSLSHSGGIGLAALADTPVGVDVERMERPFGSLRRKLCSFAEQDVPEKELVQLWTAKEAYLKLTGEGLSVPMNMLTAEGGCLVRDGKKEAVLTRFSYPHDYSITLASRIPVEAQLHIFTPDDVLQLLCSRERIYHD